MFGRSDPDPEGQRNRLRQPVTRHDPLGTREAVAVPVVVETIPPPPTPLDGTVIAHGDRLEGTLKTERSLRIGGVVEGKIESAAGVHIDEGARVTADVNADEVVVAGLYSGKLTCRQRLEILPTGRVSGTIETVKLMLHEGGFVDGGLHMQKPVDVTDPSRIERATGSEQSDRVVVRPEGLAARTGEGVRGSAGFRGDAEPSVRRPLSAGTAMTDQGSQPPDEDVPRR